MWMTPKCFTETEQIPLSSFQDGKNKAQRWTDLPETIRKPGVEFLFPKAQSGAPAKRQQYLWPVYFKCFPVNKWLGPAGGRVSYRNMGKLYPATQSHPAKPLNYLKNTSLSLSFQLSSPGDYLWEDQWTGKLQDHVHNTCIAVLPFLTR